VSGRERDARRPTTLVLGLRATGEAVVRALREQPGDHDPDGCRLVVSDDDLDRADVLARADAVRGLGVEVVAAPHDQSGWAGLLRAETVTLVVPSPGVPPSHPLIRAARELEIAVRSEIDLAAERIRVPLVAVTGTNGKTTVTELIAAMLRESGLRVACGGNIGTPLIAVASADVDVVVAEVSSFQLEFTTAAFSPRVAVLLNVADDHLDWHGSRAEYDAAKARLFAHQAAEDVLVVGDDTAARRLAATASSSVVHVRDTGGRSLLRPDGVPVLAAADLPRALPHDRANVLAAAEAALAAAGELPAIRAVAKAYRTQHHRVEFIATIDGVDFYDDSKATNPHATVCAIEAFDSVVLCAGGLNKGLSLAPIAGPADRIRAVVAFGAAADDVEAAFAGVRPVTRADSMDEVAAAAARAARPGDVVLLSPACASFDAFSDYAARGDAFARAVRARTEAPITAPVGVERLPSTSETSPPHTEVAR